MKLFVFFFCITLIFSTTFSQTIAQQDVVSMDLTQNVWGKTELKLLLVTEEGQEWWRPYFVDLTKRAVDQWNHAIHFFSEKYSSYSYISNVKLILDISSENLSNYDIYISFKDNLFINGYEALGLTTLVPFFNGTIEKCLIDLSTKSGSFELTRSDERDVAVHELGHALGLGHSNSSIDLMYPFYDLFSTTNAISTLNLYGVAVLFGWIINQDMSSDSTYITLPRGVIFEYAPVLYPAPLNPSDNPLVRSLIILFSNPYSWVMIGSLIFFLIVAGNVLIRMRKHKNVNLSQFLKKNSYSF